MHMLFGAYQTGQKTPIPVNNTRCLGSLYIKLAWICSKQTGDCNINVGDCDKVIARLEINSWHRAINQLLIADIQPFIALIGDCTWYITTGTSPDCWNPREYLIISWLLGIQNILFLSIISQPLSHVTIGFSFDWIFDNLQKFVFFLAFIFCVVAVHGVSIINMTLYNWLCSGRKFP